MVRFEEEDTIVSEGMVDLLDSKLGMVRRELAVDCVIFNALIPDAKFEQE